MWPANYNCPGQIVVSGEDPAVEEACAAAEEAGARRAVKLRVSGAFHSPLVARAADRLRPALERVGFVEPVSPFMSTVTARIESAKRMAPLLVEQLTAPVRFTQARAGPDQGGRAHLRRGRSGQRPVRAHQADRPQREDDLGLDAGSDRQARGDALSASRPRACDRPTADAFASLEGKTALVTGGSRGIGRAIALELAQAGADVTLSYRSGKDEAEEVAREAGARAVQADVADAEQAKALVEAAGELDILVNNAGVTRDGLLARMSDEDWHVVIETNLSGVFHTCRAAARGMMKRRSGSIVNISSIVGVHGNPGQTNYSASKAGIIGFTKALARELGNRGVRANVVAPGYVDTRLTQVIADEMKRADAGEHAARPFRRAGGHRRSGTVPLFRRRRRSSRARCCSSTGDWGCRVSDNGRRRVVITGIGAVTPLGNDVGGVMAAPARRRVRRWADHAVRLDRATPSTSRAR